MGPMMLPLTFAGPPLAGYIQDETGSDVFAFQIGIAVLAVVASTLRLSKSTHNNPPHLPQRSSVSFTTRAVRG